MEPSQAARLHIRTAEDQLTVSIEGRLDAHGSAAVWKQAQKALESGKASKLIWDLEKVAYLDTAGSVMILELEKKAKKNGIIDIRAQGLAPEFEAVLNLARAKGHQEDESLPPSLSYIETKGLALADFLADTRTFVTFTGQITWALFASLKNPWQIRWADMFRVMERSGVDALPIVALISFIVGLVMAFQAAIPMKMFGAEIYVANLIGIAMVRELGPLMTAIVLAGRSASAFAAEIGTMKINEEIDALTVMGLEPVRFLIVPRVIASTLVTPLLTIFSNLVGILGGALVILSFGYPLVTYVNQVTGFVTWQDFVGGIVKCFIFGILIAATGCIRGYQTGTGASAVGDATTRAVVSCIILIAVFDGIFSVVYYSLGI